MSPLARCATRLSVLHSVCVSVRKTGGDIFHTPHIKAQIFDLEYRRPRQSCWKRHSPIYKQGLSAWDVLQEGWSRARVCVCVWVDGWTGGGGESVSSEQSWVESGGSHFTQVTAVVLRDTSTRGESFFNFLIFFKGRIISLSLSVVHCCTRILQSDLIGLCESQQPPRMPMSHSLLKARLCFGMNGAMALWWCLFCVNGVKWQPCGDD